ncbi:MAG: MotA/TolQ/ExbB proton channel family protein [Lentisphaeria bacterium]|nr:MotA/TolQ/ExbB proton channel family protein [Lentisphaeria bacterium]
MTGKIKNLTARVMVFGSMAMTSALTFAQEAEEVAGDGVEATASGPGFWDIIYGNSLINLLIWCMIFATSFAAVWLIIDSIIKVKREKLIPEGVVEGVRAALEEGDLDGAFQTCEANPSPLSTILLAGFGNVTEGFEVIQEAVASSAEMESEKLMQHVNYLNLCGQIAPMLGLMGTVVGMVAAFSGLASTTGAAKAALLARSISTALWTTCIGLLISVPAVLAFTLVKNYATRLILESEATVLDLIKVLRNAEVEEEA